MSERIFKLPTGHPACGRACHRCGKKIDPGIAVYLDSEAPASQQDAVRMANGQAYVSAPRLAHLSCNPRPSPLLNRAEEMFSQPVERAQLNEAQRKALSMVRRNAA